MGTNTLFKGLARGAKRVPRSGRAGRGRVAIVLDILDRIQNRVIFCKACFLSNVAFYAKKNQ